MLPESLSQNGDRREHLHGDQAAIDAARFGRPRFYRNDLFRSYDEIHRNVMGENRKLLVQNLDGMDGGSNRRCSFQKPELASQSPLEIGITTPFADTLAPRIHGDRPRDDEVDPRHVTRMNRYTVAHGSRD